MAPPASTPIPAARFTVASSNERSGVPLDSNLCTKPAPASAKKTLPRESAENETGASSCPGPLPFTPHEPRYSNGGGGGGFGAGVARLLQEERKSSATSAVWTRLDRFNRETFSDILSA